MHLDLFTLMWQFNLHIHFSAVFILVLIVPIEMLNCKWIIQLDDAKCLTFSMKMYGKVFCSVYPLLILHSSINYNWVIFFIITSNGGWKEVGYWVKKKILKGKRKWNILIHLQQKYDTNVNLSCINTIKMRI